jgi:exosortase C (VPDSG-CTERM-specific)
MESAGWRRFAIATAALAVVFALPLYQLVRFALSSYLYSHVVLIPLISVYVVWSGRKELPSSSPPMRGWALIPLVTGAALAIFYGFLVFGGAKLEVVDSLALTTLSFLLLFWGLCGWFLGRARMRALLFPLGFLVFMVPFPEAVRTWLETALQHGSAVAAYGFFRVSGMPVFNDGVFFQLPGFSLQVAPECSGIHSTLALFITSVLASWFFLRTPWKRGVLTLSVIPLALLRNGFRVFVIGQLCVRVGPQMIDSPIHHQGGPIFFVLSLIPFFLVLYLLWRSDRSGGQGQRQRAKR